MGFIALGFALIVAGFMPLSASDSPQELVGSEIFGLGMMAVGVSAIVIGVVTHVRTVHRADRS